MSVTIVHRVRLLPVRNQIINEAGGLFSCLDISNYFVDVVHYQSEDISQSPVVQQVFVGQAGRAEKIRCYNNCQIIRVHQVYFCVRRHLVEEATEVE